MNPFSLNILSHFYIEIFIYNRDGNSGSSSPKQISTDSTNNLSESAQYKYAEFWCM